MKSDSSLAVALGHASSFFSPFSVVRPTQILGIFKKKKKNGNNVVKPFFSWNNSFNRKNELGNSLTHREKQEHSTLNEKKRGGGMALKKKIINNRGTL